MRVDDRGHCPLGTRRYTQIRGRTAAFGEGRRNLQGVRKRKIESLASGAGVFFSTKDQTAERVIR